MFMDRIDDVLHHIRCKLYPSYLPDSSGQYIARADPEARLTIEQVCYALKTRGGYEGSYQDLIKCVRLFQKELVYQLCDGYAVNLLYYSVYPVVGGMFDSPFDTFDRQKHPVGFRFRPNAILREIANDVVIEIDGLAEVTGSIDRYEDIDIPSKNGMFAPGNQFRISGRKMKLAGDDPRVGVYFVSVDEGGGEVKAARIGVNTPSRIIGIVPEISPGRYRIEIRTQFSGAVNKPLKVPRLISGGFVIETAGYCAPRHE